MSRAWRQWYVCRVPSVKGDDEDEEWAVRTLTLVHGDPQTIASGLEKDDAYLIAAAPDLLRALETITLKLTVSRDSYGLFVNGYVELEDLASALVAIAKARGRREE